MKSLFGPWDEGKENKMKTNNYNDKRAQNPTEKGRKKHQLQAPLQYQVLCILYKRQVIFDFLVSSTKVILTVKLATKRLEPTGFIRSVFQPVSSLQVCWLNRKVLPVREESHMGAWYDARTTFPHQVWPQGSCKEINISFKDQHFHTTGHTVNLWTFVWCYTFILAAHLIF